jgi:hypothetical protein
MFLVVGLLSCGTDENLLSSEEKNLLNDSYAQVEFEFENKLDSLAANVLNEIQQVSFDDGVEYCGTLYELDGIMMATPATKGEADSCEFDDDLDEEATILASYHTHGSYSLDADTEVPSIDDLMGDIEEEIKGYFYAWWTSLDE